MMTPVQLELRSGTRLGLAGFVMAFLVAACRLDAGGAMDETDEPLDGAPHVSPDSSPVQGDGQVGTRDGATPDAGGGVDATVADVATDTTVPDGSAPDTADAADANVPDTN